MEGLIKGFDFVGLGSKAKGYFVIDSGGKKIVAVKRAGVCLSAGFLLLSVGMAWLGPKEVTAFYLQSSQAQNLKDAADEVPGAVSGAAVAIFSHGRRQKAEFERREAESKRVKVSIKYLASQLIGGKANAPKVMRSGVKLVGFLISAIDTRSVSPVRVRISKGGELGGVEIQSGSVLSGQFSYPGEGDKVFVSLSRIDTPDGEPRQIQAQALDSGNYTAGITGELHSEGTTKIAASLGLTMFGGMADTLTEKESLGISQNGVQAKPTMKNALLQGLSRSAQEQSARIANEVNNVRGYLTVPEGKELIIELTGDFK